MLKLEPAWIAIYISSAGLVGCVLAACVHTIARITALEARADNCENRSDRYELAIDNLRKEIRGARNA